MRVSYPAIVHEANNCYWVEFPDLTGCITQGKTMEEVRLKAKEAMELYLDGMNTFPNVTDINEIIVSTGDKVLLIEGRV